VLNPTTDPVGGLITPVVRRQGRPWAFDAGGQVTCALIDAFFAASIKMIATFSVVLRASRYSRRQEARLSDLEHPGCC